MSFTKTFVITKEVEIDEKWMKQEDWSEEEYCEYNYEEEFFKLAEKLMDQELDKITTHDLEYEDYESEFEEEQ